MLRCAFTRFFARMEIPTPTRHASIFMPAGRRGDAKAGRRGALYLNSKNKTEMTATSEIRFYKEPTHDEIALSAFLAWERDGRPQGADLNYWFDAEARLRTQRQKQAEAAAARASKPWPPQSGTARTKPKAKESASGVATGKVKLATAVERSTAVKVSRPVKTNGARGTSRASLKTTR